MKRKISYFLILGFLLSGNPLSDPIYTDIGTPNIRFDFMTLISGITRYQ